MSVKGGGEYPPFPLGFLEPAVREGGGGDPPFPLRKNPLKIGPKNSVFWAKTAVYGEKIVRGGGGGEPPFSVNFFPLTFRKILVRGGPGGGGVPPQRKVSVPGVFDTFPN